MDGMSLLLFDWGDTLMRDIPSNTEPMAYWDKVEAMPGVMETIPLLARNYRCAVVTNAAVSDEVLVRAAFERIALDKYFIRFLTSHEIKASKPSAEFYINAAKILNADINGVCMVGNDYEKDIAGAKNAGMRTVLIGNGGDYPKADYVIKSFNELLNIIGG